jgi:uncharacterized membrane protein YqjE
MLTSLKNIAVTLAITLQTRLELLGNELQLQKLSVARQLGLGLACVFCLGLGVAMAVALAVAVWWEQRVLVLGISLGLCVLGAVWFFAALRRTVMAKEPVFAASLQALKDDLALLKSVANPNGADPDANPAND